MYMLISMYLLEIPIAVIQISLVQDQNYRDFTFYVLSVCVLSKLTVPVLRDNEDPSIRILYNCSFLLSEHCHLWLLKQVNIFCIVLFAHIVISTCRESCAVYTLPGHRAAFLWFPSCWPFFECLLFELRCCFWYLITFCLNNSKCGYRYAFELLWSYILMNIL